MSLIPTVSNVSRINLNAAQAEMPLDFSGVTLGFTTADCSCGSCCHTVCELDLGAITLETTGDGSATYSPSDEGWLSDVENSADFPEEHRYKAWSVNTTVGEMCTHEITVIFGTNSVPYPEGHPSAPGNYHFGPERLDVDSHGIGFGDWFQSGSGGPVGEVNRSYLAERDPTGIYNGSASRVIVTGNESAETVETVSITITGPCRLIGCMDAESVSLPF